MYVQFYDVFISRKQRQLVAGEKKDGEKRKAERWGKKGKTKDGTRAEERGGGGVESSFGSQSMEQITK